MARKKRIQATEELDPEAGANAIATRLENPLASFRQLAEASGMKATLIDAIVKRMDARHPSAMAELKGLSHGELIKTLDSKIAMSLSYLDDFAFANASFRDLVIGLGIMIEKKQLIQGQPTAILSIQERKHINDLLPFLVKEATRRGITIDQVPDEPTRTIPPETPLAINLSHTARRFPEEPIEVSFE